MNAEAREKLDTIGLYHKVREALSYTDDSGSRNMLNISNCEITETFDLANLILAHQEDIKDNDIRQWLDTVNKG